MKPIFLLSVAMIFGFSTGLKAQTKNEKTEIVVTNAQGNPETFNLPEGMTHETDSLMQLYYTKTYLMPDTACDFPDINPVYEKEVYMDRLHRLPTVVEMPYNDVVRKFIDRYSNDLRHSVSYMLGASNFYMNVFEQALEMYNLPLELKYLPVIESALNPKAVSRVGATGLWQFMISTAKRYGLEVNSLVDERQDPIKSSYAAAQYLSDLYKIFGDWNLVIASYNAGPDNINKAIHRSKGKTDYWEIYPYLPKETRGYVPAFIAANYIMNYYCDHNICPLMTDLPAKSDTVIVNKDFQFEQISHVLGINVDQLRELNPQYRQNFVNGTTKPSALRLPSTLVTKFIDKQDSILAYTSPELITKRDEVVVNQEQPTVSYSHKSYGRSGKSSHRRNSRSRRNRGKSITVRNGDTLSEIAERHNTTVKKLKRLNKISGNSIRAGKKIKIK